MSYVRSSTIGRVAWVGIVLLVAAAATGLQVDRESRRNSAMANLVPSVFQGYALETLARRAYAQHQDAQGLSYSRELLLRRPIPAENLSLLTQGLLASGKPNEALPILLVSAARGWRDRFTQHVLIAYAEEGDEPAVAAQRLLALWRVGSIDPQTKALTANVLSNPIGLSRFATGIAKTDDWGGGFLTWAAKEKLPKPALKIVAEALWKQHITVDCQEISAEASNLVKSGNSESATAVWSPLCSVDHLTAASDFNFRLSPTIPGPFDWRFPDQPGLDSQITEVSGHANLRYTNAEYISLILATKTSLLRAGTYTASIEFAKNGPMQTSSILLEVACFSDVGASKRVARIQISERPTPFQIPSEACGSQEITILVRHGANEIRRLRVDS